MSKVISTEASELCWIIHRYTWDHNDWEMWKKHFHEYCTIHAYDKQSWQLEYAETMWNLIKDLTWDDAVAEYERKQSGQTLQYVKEIIMRDGQKYRFAMIDEMCGAMSDDAWEADAEYCDAIDTNVVRDVVEEEDQ